MLRTTYSYVFSIIVFIIKLFSFLTEANASKYCTLTSEWFQDDSNVPWTNYSQCYSESTVSLPVNFTGFTNGNPFISVSTHSKSHIKFGPYFF